jgi:hypothetical protein
MASPACNRFSAMSTTTRVQTTTDDARRLSKPRYPFRAGPAPKDVHKQRWQERERSRSFVLFWAPHATEQNLDLYNMSSSISADEGLVFGPGSFWAIVIHYHHHMEETLSCVLLFHLSLKFSYSTFVNRPVPTLESKFTCPALEHRCLFSIPWLN